MPKLCIAVPEILRSIGMLGMHYFMIIVVTRRLARKEIGSVVTSIKDRSTASGFDVPEVL